MAVTVRFFAALRERVGRDTLIIEGQPPRSVQALRARIGACLGPGVLAAVSAREIRVALNQEFVSGDASLSDGDEVAFMPPITGG